MFALKFLKILLLVALCASACRFWQPKTDANAAPAPPIIVEEVKSTIPFATKEPETFQTEIVVTIGDVETTIFTARRGASRLTIYEFQTENEFAVLQTGAGASYTIARRRKIYAENQTADSSAATDENFPTAELLNQKQTAVFEKLGAENNLTKYRVVLDEPANSEIVVTVDENINLPVRQEFYSVAGDRKTLVSTTELRNFNLRTDAANFELPKDYKKVSPAELRR